MTWLESIQNLVAPVYRAFADGLADDHSVGEVVVLYSWPNLEERNETHEMEEYLPSHVAIGNDSGDYEFLIRRDGSPKVYWCDAGSLGSEEPEEVHSDFAEWLEAGCPLPEEEEPDLPFPLQGPIWLIKAPENGLKGMFDLRKHLGLSWASSEMRGMMDGVPLLLIEDGRPYALTGQLDSSPEYLACLGWGSRRMRSSL